MSDTTIKMFTDNYFTEIEEKIIKGSFGINIKILFDVEIKSELSFSKHQTDTAAQIWAFEESNILRPEISASLIDSKKKEADIYRRTKGECCICAYNITDEDVNSRGLAKLPTKLIYVDKWCVFDTVKLCNNCIEMASNYRTISYVWGSGICCKANQYIQNTTEHLIDHNGARMRRILEVIKKTGAGKYVWMDMFCIDQSDAVTKGAEIARMAHYYSWSHSTIIFLDIDLSLSGLVLAKENYYVKTLDSLTMRNKLLTIAGLRQPLICNEWFTRVWTLQEWMLAQKVRICLIDSAQMDVNYAFLSYDFLNALMTFDEKVLYDCITQEDRKNALKLYSNLGRSEFIDYTNSMFELRRYDSSLSASSAIQLGGRRFCKNEQDKIVGVIGLTGISAVRSYPSSLTEALENFIQESIAIGDYSLIVGPYSTNHNLGWRCLIPIDIEEIRFSGRTHRLLGQPGSVIEGIGIKLNLVDTNYNVAQYTEAGNYMRMKMIDITKWQAIKDVVDLQITGYFYTDSKDIIGARLFVVRPCSRYGSSTFGLLLNQVNRDHWHCVGKSNNLKVKANTSLSVGGFETLRNTSIIIGH
ncbi:8752_t:CDS:1 [Diversispora eburnea]|uniref:8752_t:CDS:1 n=1 Tax=Diversispora eburnea TaxID=1213867 RepID=A0A9N9GFM2_9GLOM|nr:8752_t:CDS:1 [Diversispora eburnea]